MKNKTLLIFILLFSALLFLNIFTISLIKAETQSLSAPGDSDSALPPELQEIQTAGEKLTDKEQRSDYLKQEWGKILEKNKFFGPIIANYKKISPYIDPVFEYTIGMTPSLTWLFVLTFSLWIAFVIYMIRILDLVSIFSKWVQYLMSFGFVIILSITGVTKKLAEYIINMISLFNTWWMQLIGIVLVIIGLVVASIFSKQIKELAKAMEEKKKKEKEEINRQKLESNVKVAEAFTEGITGK